MIAINHAEGQPFNNKELHEAAMQAQSNISQQFEEVLGDSHNFADVRAWVDLALHAITRDTPTNSLYEPDHIVSRLAEFQRDHLQKSPTGVNYVRDMGMAVTQLASALGLKQQLDVELRQRAQHRNGRA